LLFAVATDKNNIVSIYQDGHFPGACPQAASRLGMEEIVRGPIKSKPSPPCYSSTCCACSPAMGPRLMSRIESVCSGLLGVNTNTVYPLLRRLEESGFIVGEWGAPTKRSRRYYRITDAGRARLERIKAGMLPCLDMLAGSIERPRTELYDSKAR
jgi:DNA-binding PadR family transcriptional regulator